MANIIFMRIYTPFREEWCDIAYEKDGYITKVCSYTTDEMPKTAKKWLEGKVGRKQYNKVFEREEIIYKAETVYRVEYDFYAGDKNVHAYLDNNGKGFCHEDAVYIGKQLVAQGNRHISIIAI